MQNWEEYVMHQIFGREETILEAQIKKVINPTLLYDEENE